MKSIVKKIKTEKEFVADQKQELRTKSIEYKVWQKFYPINFRHYEN